MPGADFTLCDRRHGSMRRQLASNVLAWRGIDDTVLAERNNGKKQDAEGLTLDNGVTLPTSIPRKEHARADRIERECAARRVCGRSIKACLAEPLRRTMCVALKGAVVLVVGLESAEHALATDGAFCHRSPPHSIPRDSPGVQRSANLRAGPARALRKQGP